MPGGGTYSESCEQVTKVTKVLVSANVLAQASPLLLGGSCAGGTQKIFPPFPASPDRPKWAGGALTHRWVQHCR